MPTQGIYQFKLAPAAVDGFVADEKVVDILPGEWAWVDRSDVFEGTLPGYFVMLYARCPDCEQLMTLYRKRGKSEAQGHTIDPHGNIHPSVLHTWKVDGKEQCGFHTAPTKLLGFVDKRK